ncbi:MAG TPA: alpha/beta fold hydrolase [Longimicrobiales bacterium]|nr:alpha/beta fold hydrolase [Longimicrobiales bacterium]
MQPQRGAPFTIPVPHGGLEALLRGPAEDEPVRGAAVVCHPHPLHGGTMHTKAVYRAAQALAEAGLAALRFNFRGVGRSTGSYDDGVGERDDARAALDWLAERYPASPLVAGGFSFGSEVGLAVGAEDSRVVALLGLGLPVERGERYDFGWLASVEKPVLIVQGEQDEFGSGARIAELAGALGDHVTLVRVPGADHYFTDRLDELRAAIREYFLNGAGAAALAAGRPEGAS